jgi:hypothetical protein
MKKIITLVTLGLIFLTLGCGGTKRQVVSEGPQDHQHFNSRTKAIGDYHAQLVVNHRRGKIFLLVSDIHEDPKKIKAKKIDALMIFSDKSEKNLSFKPDMVQSRRKKGTNSFLIQGDWIKSVHEFDIKFMIPISGKIYEVIFAYKKSDLEDIHHKHNDCGKDCLYQ